LTRQPPSGSKLHLGLACAWWTPREPTWSYTPSRLLQALRRRPEQVTSIEIQRSIPVRAALALLYAPTSMPWKYGQLHCRLAARSIRRKTARARCDAVVTLADETHDAGVPTFAYQDMNFASFHDSLNKLEPRMINTVTTTTARNLSHLAERQADQYKQLSGVFAWSEWFRQQLIGQGHPPSSIEVVGAGINGTVEYIRSPRDDTQRTRLLFVGVHFERKAGDQVVAAVELLRREGEKPLTLTVIGPKRWPLADQPPSWIEFLGPIRPGQVGSLYPEHDLFVMPSRFEAYGIALLEAQAAGVPCLARRAFAMPELVPEGRAGVLVEPHDGPPEIAAKINEALGDDALHETLVERASEVRDVHSWDAVAARIATAAQRRL
jgi:glycosyltransferase involved in cell wall biosynthesis